tara:strand:- start:1305 stop:2117 length:813 start_codon:yes stop_codon:yes gene_type:complete
LNSILFRFIKNFSTLYIAIYNLGIIPSLKILFSKILKKNTLIKIYSKKFGFIYWRSKLDFGVITHFFTPQVTFNTKKKDVKIIIDLGANIGIETLRLKKLFTKSTVIALEANKENYNVLKKNTERDANIISLNKGIWNKNTSLNLKNFDPNSAEGYSYEENMKSDNNNIIEAITINELIKQFSIEEIDILKIDIEGAEKYLFDETCDNWIKKVNTFIIECPDNDAPYTTLQIFEAFRRNGLKFKTYINGENFIFVKSNCDFEPEPILFYQ